MSEDIQRIEHDRVIEHPMEQVLGIEPGTTVVTKEERSTELVKPEEYDDKDSEIESDYQEIYDAAMSAFDEQMMASEGVDGKYKARNGEVAVQFLNAALNAAKSKADLKKHKDNHNVAVKKAEKAGTTNNNLIVADRNELLAAIMRQKDVTPE